MTNNTQLLMFMTMFLIASLIITTEAYRERNPRSYERAANDAEPKKRPFCNAFTGCGKKRSEKPLLEQSQPETMDDSLGTLLDLNSEPAIEDLTRQIMSEAKLWEAIQEASRELQVQKIGKNKDALSIVFNTQ